MSRQRIVLLAIVTVLFFGAIGAFLFLRVGKHENPQTGAEGQASETRDIPQDGIKPSEEASPTGNVQEEELQSQYGKIPDLDRPPVVKRDLSNEVLTQSTMDIANTITALKEDVSQFDLWLRLASLRKLIGDYSGSRDALEFANRLAPKNSVGYSMLANLYWSELKDYPKAEKNFFKVIENDPSDTSAYRNLSDLYRYNYTQKKDQADDILLEGLQKNPNHRDLISYLAAYYRDTGNTAEAKIYLEKLLAITNDAQMRAQIQSDLDRL